MREDLKVPERVRLSRWTVLHRHDGRVTALHTATAALARLDGPEAALVERAAEGDSIALSEFDLRAHRQLLTTFFVPEGFDELQRMHSSWYQARASTDELSLVVVTSGGCNFSCFYCFEGKKEGRLSEQTANALVALVRERLPLRQLHVDWFGGEPLVNLDAIVSISSQLRALAAEHPFQFISTMTTNGYLLTPERTDVLAAHGLQRALITFDGPRAQHNKIRRGPGIHDSFERILENVTYASTRLGVRARIHVSKWNHTQLPTLLHELAAAGLAGKVMVFFAPLHDLGTGSTKLAGRVLDNDFFARVSLDLTDVALGLGFSVGVDGPTSSTLGCNVIFPNQLLVDADGSVKHCYLDVGDERQSHATLLPEGQLKPLEGRQDRWVGYSPLDSDCATCRFLPMCWGGCHWEAIHDRPPEERCHPMKLQPALHLERMVSWLQRGCVYDPVRGMISPPSQAPGS